MKSDKKNLTASEVFENRRKFPRLKMNLPVMIIGPDGKKFKGLLYDISPDGAQVRFSAKDEIIAKSKKQSHVEKIKSMKCVLVFDLAYSENISRVKLDAYPLYSSHIDDKSISAGMVFSEADLAENKKISDFLFYQLALAFIDVDNPEETKTSTRKDDESKKTKVEEKQQNVKRTSIEITGVNEKLLSPELNELILNIDHSKADFETFKVLLYRVMNSLQVIQETTRHVDERIRIIEHKLSRKD